MVRDKKDNSMKEADFHFVKDLDIQHKKGQRDEVFLKDNYDNGNSPNKDLIIKDDSSDFHYYRYSDFTYCCFNGNEKQNCI